MKFNERYEELLEQFQVEDKMAKPELQKDTGDNEEGEIKSEVSDSENDSEKGKPEGEPKKLKEGSKCEECDEEGFGDGSDEDDEKSVEDEEKE
jgi:hypothetical protein